MNKRFDCSISDFVESDTTVLPYFISFVFHFIKEIDEKLTLFKVSLNNRFLNLFSHSNRYIYIYIQSIKSSLEANVVNSALKYCAYEERIKSMRKRQLEFYSKVRNDLQKRKRQKVEP